MFADPTCPICLDMTDGDRPCPVHRGTYHAGIICPVTNDPDHVVIVCQYGAAYLCCSCEDIFDELLLEE